MDWLATFSISVLGFLVLAFGIGFIAQKANANRYKRKMEHYRDMWDESVGFKAKPENRTWRNRVKPDK